MSTVAILAQLEIVTGQINRYLPSILFFSGLVGNLLNCLVFTRRKLRSNPCSVCFLAASLLNLIVCVTAFLPRIVDGWNEQYDLSQTIPIFCKLTLGFLFTTRSIVVWLIALATIDRYLASSPNIHRRQMGNLKNTYRFIILISLVLFIISLVAFFCADANMVGTPLKCFSKSNVCRLYNNFTQALTVVIIPITVMIVFGFCTIRNIHRSGRVAPNNNNEHTVARNRRRESSLTKMLLTQVLILILLTLPFAIMTSYLSFTFYQEKTMFQSAIENFIFNILLLVAYIPNCISFFFYTLSGSVFREAFIELGKKLIRRLRCCY